MKLTIKKSLPYQVLLGLCCAVPYLSNYELTFALWTFTILITLKKSYSFRFLNYLLCFLAIFFLALVVTDFHDSETYFMIRDVTYLLKPVLGLLLGYQICRHIYKNAIETIIYAGFGVSIIHIFVMLKTFFIFHHISVALLRDHCGFFSDFEVYALIFVLFHKPFEVSLTPKRFRYLVITIGFSAFMYLSRTNFIQFVVLFLAMKGYFVLNKRAIIAIISVVIGTIVLYSAVLMINPRRNGSGFEEFLYKIKVAPTEPCKSKVNANDYKDFNLNYRSLESIYTIKQVRGTKHVLIGSGLGSQIDLKQEVFLGDMKLRYISVLHNGFMTTYLKSGIVGVLILTFSIFLLSRQKKTQIPINRQFNFLMVGTAIFLLVSNWVLMGYYFTQDSKSILVGLMFAYTEMTARNYANDKVSGEGA
jgi:hypothetical protein